jgi:hypothetical protein
LQTVKCEGGLQYFCSERGAIIMTPRENLIRTVKRKNPEYVPFHFNLSPSLVEEFKKKQV